MSDGPFEIFLKVMQLATLIGVLGSNVKYHWTNQEFVAGLVALCAVSLATAIVRGSQRFGGWLLEWLTLLRNH
jgi:hypothetical protein